MKPKEHTGNRSNFISANVTNTMTKNYFDGERVYLTYKSRLQAIPVGINNKNLKARDLAIPHSITYN